VSSSLHQHHRIRITASALLQAIPDRSNGGAKPRGLVEARCGVDLGSGGESDGP